METENIWGFKILDLLVQAAIVCTAFIYRPFMAYSLFVGGAWQIISFAIHRKAIFTKSKARRRYWRAVMVMFGLFGTGLFIFLLAMVTKAEALMTLMMLLLVIYLVGGVLLYAIYFIICFSELVEKHTEKASVETTNLQNYEA